MSATTRFGWTTKRNVTCNLRCYVQSRAVVSARCEKILVLGGNHSKRHVLTEHKSKGVETLKLRHLVEASAFYLFSVVSIS
jgi:hypothetical protein